MARIINKKEYDAKRNEILDLALKLIYSKGYAQVTIQDILDGLQISKGALYHYFDSKHAILEALVERMENNAKQTILPIAENSNLSAIQKFRSYFETSARWKNQQKELIISLLRMWYSDENILIRQKMTTASLKHLSPFFESIIRQGIKENVFKTQFPAQVGIIIAGVALSLSDTIIELLLSNAELPNYKQFEKIIDAYFETIERILGAPSGSLKTFNADTFKEWWNTLQENHHAKKVKN